MKKCRVCNAVLFPKPLLKYKDMPKASQNFPNSRNLRFDKGVDLDVFQCTGCGLVQLTDKPVPYYREVIRASAFSTEMRNFRLKQFKDFVKNHSLSGKKILEIGCGKGEYLSLMKASGVKTFGTEYGSTSVKYCKKNGLKVFGMFPEKSEQNIQGSPFDAFFMLNFLEHLPSLNTVLKFAANNLKDGGIGIIEVPNFDMILKKNLFSEFIGDHLFYFTEKTLRTALELNGFEVIKSRVVWHDYIISSEIRKRPCLDIKTFYAKQSKLTKDLKGFILKLKGKRLAVWGAGHQALAVIALTGIKNEISYVIDSAPFKQGKYTPASHIKIVAPDELKKSPVSAIIVMAASYSDEVAKLIKKNYDSKIKIAVLRDFGLEQLR